MTHALLQPCHSATGRCFNKQQLSSSASNCRRRRRTYKARYSSMDHDHVRMSAQLPEASYVAASETACMPPSRAYRRTFLAAAVSVALGSAPRFACTAIDLDINLTKFAKLAHGLRWTFVLVRRVHGMHWRHVLGPCRPH